MKKKSLKISIIIQDLVIQLKNKSNSKKSAIWKNMLQHQIQVIHQLCALQDANCNYNTPWENNLIIYLFILN